MTERLRRYFVLKIANCVYASQSVVSVIREWEEMNLYIAHEETTYQRRRDAEIFMALGGDDPSGVPWE